MKSWISQFRRGLLELCVLSHLSVQDDHGYQVVQRLKQIDGLEVRESTVYPILARLKTEGFVAVHSEPSPGGPPRKIYHLTRPGKERLRSLYAYWDLLTEAVDTLREAHEKGSDS